MEFLGSAFLLSIFLLPVILAAPPVKPGDECHPTQNNCNGVPNTECVNNGDGTFSCQCHSGWITDTVNGRCIHTPRRPGDPCAPNLAGCNLVANSDCLNRGGPAAHICVCRDEYATLPDRCLSNPTRPSDECFPVDAPCPANIDCTCASGGGGSTGYTCQCNGDQVTDPVAKVCLRRPVNPGDSCHPQLTACAGVSLTSCELNGGGPDHWCQCNSAHVTAEGVCWKIPTAPGQQCHPQHTPCTGLPQTGCNPNPNGGGDYCECEGDLVTDVPGGRCLVRPTQPGQPCHPGLTPCDFDDNLDCLPGQNGDTETRCRCVGDYVDHPNEARCVKKPLRPGDECLTVGAPCTTVEGTECGRDPGSDPEVFRCFCTGGLITDASNGRCIPRPALPGDACAPGLAPCENIANTTCEMDGVGGGGLPYCKCTQEFFTDEVGRRCLKFATKPGQKCFSEYGVTCDRVTSDQTTCTQAEDSVYEYCKCDGADRVTDEIGERCIKEPGRPGEPCDAEFTPCEGITNTTCIQDPDDPTEWACACDLPQVTDPVQGRCLFMPERPGQLCDQTFAPCTYVAGTECDRPAGHPEYSCRCTGGLATDPDHGLCIEYPTQPGHSCHPAEADCRPQVARTTCELVPDSDASRDGFWCQCEGDLITDPYGGQCLTSPALPGDPCQPTAAPCDEVEGTECAENPEGGYFCKCHQGYITIPDLGKCIRVPQAPGDECEAFLAPCNGPALVNTSCINLGSEGPFCICNSGLITDGGKCFPSPTNPGDVCSVSHGAVGDCKRVHDTNCEEDFPVGRGLYCKCDPTRLFTDFFWKECVPLPARPNERCDQTNLVSTCLRVPNSECLAAGGNYYWCRCNSGTFTTEDECVPLPAKPYDRCGAAAHCGPLPFTECVTPPEEQLGANHTHALTVCACLPDYHLSLDSFSCLPRAEFVGEPCDQDEHCSRLFNTRCLVDDFGPGFCQCVPETVASATRKYCLPIIRTLGGVCTEDVQCRSGIGGETECESGQCACKTGHVESGDKARCLRVSEIDGPCQEHQQCTAVLGPYSECSALQQCACVPGAGHMNSRCHRRVPVGNGCSTDEECVLGTNRYTFCNGGSAPATCTCLPSAIPWQQSCFGDLSIGDPCSSDLECAVPIRDGICDRRNLTCACPYEMHPVTDKICWRSSSGQGSSSRTLHGWEFVFVAMSLQLMNIVIYLSQP